MYLWLCWVFVALHGLSLVVANRGCSLLQRMGFSLQWLLLLWSAGSVVVTRGLSCFVACGILLDQELNLCPRYGRWTPIH